MSETRTLRRPVKEGEPEHELHTLTRPWPEHEPDQGKPYPVGTAITTEFRGHAPAGPKGGPDTEAPVWVDEKRFAQLLEDGFLTVPEPSPAAAGKKEPPAAAAEKEPAAAETLASSPQSTDLAASQATPQVQASPFVLDTAAAGHKVPDKKGGS